jgi:hypothetical protein
MNTIGTCSKNLSKPPPCSFGLPATSQQYFSLRTNQPSATSTFLSEQTSTSHQPPTKRTGCTIRTHNKIQIIYQYGMYRMVIVSFLLHYIQRKQALSSTSFAERARISVMGELGTEQVRPAFPACSTNLAKNEKEAV